MAKKDRPKFPQLFQDIWWLVLLQGIVALIFGWLMISRPGMSFAIFIQFIGAFWLIDGILTIVKSIEGRKHISGWGWGIVGGIFSILASIVIFINPVISAAFFSVFLIWFIGFAAIFAGIWSFVTGIRLRKEISNEWSMILGGLMGVAFGVLILVVDPVAQTVVLTIFLGFFALTGGIMQIISAFRVRRAAIDGVEEAKS